MNELSYVTRFGVDDRTLTDLHARAFGNLSPDKPEPWAARLERHSLSWIGAFRRQGDADRLLGFVHACWDGGTHAFLLDTVVDPEHQGRGIGRNLVRRLVAEVRTAGCGWLHVDYEPELHGFYSGCGFHPTSAGLLRL